MNTLIIAAVLFLMLGFWFISSRNADKYQKLERELQEQKEKFHAVIDSANDAIISADSESVIIAWNQGASRIFGYQEAEVLGKKLTMIIPKHMRNAQEAGIKRFLMTKEAKVVGKAVELEGLHKDGSRIPIELSLSTWSIAKDIYFSGIIRDISERKRAEIQISHLVYHDDLTELPNRRYFEKQMKTELKNAEENGAKLILMLLDLDRFKMINDTLGHSFGDKLLYAAAGRLKELLGPYDMIARMGGDEFNLLMPDVPGRESGVRMAEDIMEIFSKPIEIDGHELFVSTSIGMVQYPDHGNDMESLMRRADMAMYSAKERGTSNYKFYSKKIDSEDEQKIKLEKDMRRAIEENEFVVYYQPKIEIETENVVGLEALVRWCHPELGMIPPNQFIPLAEETGLIVQLGEKVLRMACAQTKAWQERGYDQLQISVNVSSRQFHGEHFVETVTEVLADTALEPEYLELEVTEHMTMNNVYRAEQILDQLVKLGVKIAIDDFGVEYSSLNYLKKYPIHTLKIDQSFVQDLSDDSNHPAIITAIITLAKDMGLNIVAEGVETRQQYEFLKGKKCEQAQGFLFYRPMPVEEVENLLEEQSSSLV
ncbi:putative bifunctional diguanylate cyclase/phosphodiesterase [Lentibacillus sediminis]|uniref:putative bifunctional diguanylate cyclase/phosphodiesterase n=1 Tax=Lentibacillus sediminis TaxID=1940529 RepID=UPI000C1B82AA|nr:EAL domain-containing protein [Lentibacillus sediminis]